MVDEWRPRLERTGNDDALRGLTETLREHDCSPAVSPRWLMAGADKSVSLNRNASKKGGDHVRACRSMSPSEDFTQFGKSSPHRLLQAISQSNGKQGSTTELEPRKIGEPLICAYVLAESS